MHEKLHSYRLVNVNGVTTVNKAKKHQVLSDHIIEDDDHNLQGQTALSWVISVYVDYENQHVKPALVTNLFIFLSLYSLTASMSHAYELLQVTIH